MPAEYNDFAVLVDTEQELPTWTVTDPLFDAIKSINVVQISARDLTLFEREFDVDILEEIDDVTFEQVGNLAVVVDCGWAGAWPALLCITRCCRK